MKKINKITFLALALSLGVTATACNKKKVLVASDEKMIVASYFSDKEFTNARKTISLSNVIDKYETNGLICFYDNSKKLYGISKATGEKLFEKENVTNMYDAIDNMFFSKYLTVIEYDDSMEVIDEFGNTVFEKAKYDKILYKSLYAGGTVYNDDDSHISTYYFKFDLTIDGKKETKIVKNDLYYDEFNKLYDSKNEIIDELPNVDKTYKANDSIYVSDKYEPNEYFYEYYGDYINFYKTNKKGEKKLTSSINICSCDYYDVYEFDHTYIIQRTYSLQTNDSDYNMTDYTSGDKLYFDTILIDSKKGTTKELDDFKYYFNFSNNISDIYVDDKLEYISGSFAYYDTISGNICYEEALIDAYGNIISDGIAEKNNRVIILDDTHRLSENGYMINERGERLFYLSSDFTDFELFNNGYIMLYNIRYRAYSIIDYDGNIIDESKYIFLERVNDSTALVELGNKYYELTVENKKVVLNEVENVDYNYDSLYYDYFSNDTKIYNRDYSIDVLLKDTTSDDVFDCMDLTFNFKDKLVLGDIIDANLYEYEDMLMIYTVNISGEINIYLVDIVKN